MKEIVIALVLFYTGIAIIEFSSWVNRIILIKMRIEDNKRALSYDSEERWDRYKNRIKDNRSELRDLFKRWWRAPVWPIIMVMHIYTSVVVRFFQALKESKVKNEE